jgi:hypothetical protein
MWLQKFIVLISVINDFWFFGTRYSDVMFNGNGKGMVSLMQRGSSFMLVSTWSQHFNVCVYDDYRNWNHHLIKDMYIYKMDWTNCWS